MSQQQLEGVSTVDLVVEGSLAELRSDFTTALEYYLQAQQYDSSSAGLDWAIAKMYNQLGYYTNAMQALENGLRKDPENYAILSDLADFKEIAQDYPRLVALYKKMHQLHSNDIYVLTRLASIHSLMGHISDAVEVYEKINDIYGLSPEQKQQLGHWYLQVDQPLKAIQCFNENSFSISQDENTIVKLGQHLVQVGQVQSAIDLYRTTLEIDSNLEHVISSLTTLYENEMKYDQIVTLHETLYAQDSTSFNRITGLAEVHFRFGSKARAYQLFARLSKEFPNDARAVSAVQHAQVREIYAATSALTGVELFFIDESSDDQIDLHFGTNQRSAHKNSNLSLSQALDLIEFKLISEPENPVFLDVKAVLLYNLGRTEDAVDAVKRSFELNNNNSENSIHLGDI